MYNHQLDTFIAAADSGSFTKAAEKLYISPTAVLQQINLLEDSCGFSLFDRTNHGVRLTAAGKSLYDDAQTLIRFSTNALDKAKILAKASETTVRIATDVLYKCRVLPELCARAGEVNPSLRFEIPPISSQFKNPDGSFRFGQTHDIIEGIFCTDAWKNRYNFLELSRTPMSCAVSRNHRLASKARLSIDDLDGETLMMPIVGAAYELDEFRRKISEKYPSTRILDSPGYGLNTFTLCEMNGYVLMTHPVYADIHTNLVTVPLDTDYSLPYGLIYGKDPTPATKKFIEIVRNFKDKE